MDFKLRFITSKENAVIDLVASRMRATLVEVLGEEVGRSMYTQEWLVDRVRFHLDRSLCEGAVVVAEDLRGSIAGHMILRVEKDDCAQFGLFSTFYVLPCERRQGLASRFIVHGEQWMRKRGLSRARTSTGEANRPLIEIMEKHGYTIVLRSDAMVALEKTFMAFPEAEVGHFER